MKQRLLPKNDKIFKIIFGRKENSWIFKEFVHDLIGIEVNEVTYLDPTKIFSIRHSKEEEVKKKAASKTRIVDILMEINNQTMLTLEMQVRKTNYFLERIMLYILDVYGYNYGNKEKMREPNNKYSGLEPAIQICILDYNEFDDDKAIHQFHLTGEDAVDGVKRLITIVTFELHKPIINVEDPVSRDNLEAMRSIYIDGVLDSDAPKYVQAVYKKSNYYNLTKEDQLEVDAIESAIDQREAELSYAKIEGKNEGMIEEKFEVAQSLLAQGIDLNIIIKATKLSAEEIEKLK